MVDVGPAWMLRPSGRPSACGKGVERPIRQAAPHRADVRQELKEGPHDRQPDEETHRRPRQVDVLPLRESVDHRLPQRRLTDRLAQVGKILNAFKSEAEHGVTGDVRLASPFRLPRSTFGFPA